MRAASELLSLLQTAGSVPLWRADEVEDSGGPVLASGFAELDRALPGGGWPRNCSTAWPCTGSSVRRSTGWRRRDSDRPA